MFRLAARAASALVLASALTLAFTTSALADPPQPAATDIAGVGAGTTEALFNQHGATGGSAATPARRPPSAATASSPSSAAAPRSTPRADRLPSPAPARRGRAGQV
ncbi:hypothetical protein GCM10009639_57560 [Kitasatospora putterlickiae]|uniref:Uncharacterized protein n=1 Tax=Kitasatospora putterlickiae TaxID=221725 RepID=A0ABN1YEP0_9ACTN